MLEKKEIISIKGPFPKNILPDLVWGQLRRYLKKTENQLTENDFKVLRSELWSDEKEIFFIFELESLLLQKSKKVIGPKASDEENTKRFLEKKRKILSGPRIENDRVIIEIEREETSAVTLLEKFVKASSKVEKDAMRKTLRSSKILTEKLILKEYKKGFAQYLTNYLEGKEVFE